MVRIKIQRLARSSLSKGMTADLKQKRRMRPLTIWMNTG
jgi:hypothetical protein